MLALMASVQQADPRLIGEIERLGSALWIVAIAALVVGTLSLAALVASLLTLRQASRLISNLRMQLDRLSPRAEPLIEKLSALATDARDTTDVVRRRVTGLMDTVSDINGSLQDAARAAELRIREFSAVVDVVKHELEEVLMDTAATARGIQATTRALRGAPVPHGGEGDDAPPGAEPPALLEAGEFDDAAPVRRARATAGSALTHGARAATEEPAVDGGAA